MTSQYFRELSVKKFALIMIVAVVWLAGCAGGEPPSGQERVVAGALAGGDDFSRRFVAVVLPPRVDLQFPFVLTSERLYTRENGGETRRGLMLEFTEGDAGSVAEELVRGFGKGGYKPRRAPAATPEGRVAFTLTKRGSVPVYVDVRPAGKRKLGAPGALGTVWISWRVRDEVGTDGED